MKATKFRTFWVTSVGTGNSDGADCLFGAIRLVSEGWTKVVGPSKTLSLLPFLAVLLASLLAPRSCSAHTMTGKFAIPRQILQRGFLTSKDWALAPSLLRLVLKNLPLLASIKDQRKSRKYDLRGKNWVVWSREAKPQGR